MSETSRFTDDILSAARVKADAIVLEAESETEKALEEEKARLSREADEILRNARTESEGIKRRQMSEVTHRLKLREQSEKSRIVNEVLREAKERLVEFAKDEAKYYPFLVNLVAESVQELGMEDPVLHLNAQDIKRLEKTRLERDVSKKLGREIKFEFSKNALNAVGGVVVTSRDEKTRIVNTLDQRFEALESKLLMEAGKILFA